MSIFSEENDQEFRNLQLENQRLKISNDEMSNELQGLDNQTRIDILHEEIE